LKKLKKILFVTLGIALLVGLMISMGFVNQKQNAMPYEALEVNVNQDNELYFLDKKDIVQLLNTRGDSVVRMPRQKVNIPEIEQALNSHENIANAEVFATIDGKMKIKVKQRKPVVRIFNMVGETYYIDEEGLLMPVSEKYTANVLVANGYIYESYARYYKQPVYEVKNKTVVPVINMLDYLFVTAKYIDSSEFWRNQIQQVYVNKNRELELVPLAGNHKIIFGDTIGLNDKFKKLYTFYRQGLNVTGWWDKYSVINLKFKDQIVCTRKI
jgi:cell division protein FtsQ